MSENAYRIAVLTKYVPDTQFEQKLDDTLRVDRSESVMSELDEYAVEAAGRGGAVRPADDRWPACGRRRPPAAQRSVPPVHVSHPNNTRGACCNIFAQPLCCKWL